VSDFSVTEAKTKALVARLKTMGASDALIVSDAVDDKLWLAARNIPNVDIRTVAHADPVALLRHEKVIMTQAALKKFEEMLV
jgi:large subunit ribosomal protein L4